MAEITIDEEKYEDLKGQVIQQDMILTRLLSQPLVYATVISSKNEFDLSKFEQGDRLVVIDPVLLKKKKYYGKIGSKGVDADGWLTIEYPLGGKDRVNIGLNKQLPQVKLVGKDDGTNCVISHEGKWFEVHGLPRVHLKVSDTVKVNIETRQIHEKATISSAGEVAHVKRLVDNTHVEVESNGHTRVVINGVEKILEAGDRIMLDHTNAIAVRVLEKDCADRFNLVEQVNVTWDDIAGCGDVKEKMIEALELPYQHPEIFKYYNKKIPKGILLYGPPGCGKSLAARCAASSMARIHGKENYQSGFIYVKGPELLSKWIGQAESEIRQLFARGREHYKKHGYPALLFIDEADAIVPMRGSGKSSDIENTIVPMFLSEMDGLTEAHLMVMLATNQPKRLDPAITREGRIDQHIRVSRPNVKNAHEYFNIHMKNVPVQKGHEREEIIALAIKDLFSERRKMFKVKYREREMDFRLADSVSGAMIAGLVQQATSKALRRDLESGKKSGVSHDDFHNAIDDTTKSHTELNAVFDLEDYCDIHGLNRNEVQISKA